MNRELLEALLRDAEPIQSSMQEEIERCSSVKCHRCQGKCIAELDGAKIARNIENEGNSGFHYLSRCLSCRSLFEPYTGIVVEIGNLADAKPDSIPIIDPTKFS